GHAVNLTSRVEAATKVFGVSCLITSATRQALTTEMPLRRVCRARLTGMVEPVDLYELAAALNEPNGTGLRERYEAALMLYERSELSECQQACQELLGNIGASDGPTKWLLSRAE